MAETNDQKIQPIIVIVGQTASGKSALSMRAAELFNGEIICADSRTVYKDMDLGTAKPTVEDRYRVPHHGLDLIEPTEYFSAAAFKRYANQAVLDIRSRNHIPFIVGGTGLYVDGFVYDFDFAEQADRSLRAELEALSLDDLQVRATELGITETDIDFKNHRHLSRAVERGGVTISRQPKPQNVLLLGIQLEREVLLERIAQRVDTMFDNGFTDEVQKLINSYGTDAPGLLAPGYKAVSQYLAGQITLDEAKELFIRSDKYLAKRQLTWFKRNKDIIWVQSEEQAIELMSDFVQV